MRRRFVLAWNWGDYQSIVKRLQSGNGALQTLVSQSEKLGSSRGRRSQDRFVKLIRRLSQAIFEAICTATSCNCPQPHSLCLQLVPREAVLLDSDKEDEIALSHNFHVMFNPKIANQTSSNSGGQHSNSMTMFQPNRWESLHIRAAKPKPKSAASPVPTAPPSGQGQTSKLSHRLSEIRTFLSRLRHSTNSVTQPTANLTNITTSSELSLIADLCQMVSTRGKSAAKACYGYIEDESYIFGVHDRDERFRLDSSITLGRVLESEDLKEKLRERLQIALAISTGILHLHDTEWLTRPWAPDDVMLLSEENADASRYPFVVNQVRPTTTSGASSARNASLVRPTNLKVVSLGAVLAQIAIGRRVGGLDVPSTPDDQAIGAVRNELEQLELQVEICAGKEYKEALQWCCRNIFELATLADHQHAYDFYEHVVKKLQSSLNHVERRLGL